MNRQCSDLTSSVVPQRDSSRYTILRRIGLRGQWRGRFTVKRENREWSKTGESTKKPSSKPENFVN